MQTKMRRPASTSMQSDKHLCCSKKGISFEQNILILKHEIWGNSYALFRLGKLFLEECLAWINITLTINMGMFLWFCSRLSEPMGIFWYWNTGFVFCSTWYVSISFYVSQFVETIHITFILNVGIFLRFCLHKEKFNLNLMTFPYWSIVVFCIRWDNSYVSQLIEKIHIPFMWKMGIFLIFCLHKEKFNLNFNDIPILKYWIVFFDWIKHIYFLLQAYLQIFWSKVLTDQPGWGNIKL